MLNCVQDPASVVAFGVQHVPSATGFKEQYSKGCEHYFSPGVTVSDLLDAVRRVSVPRKLRPREITHPS
jgi:hypothetical protein